MFLSINKTLDAYMVRSIEESLKKRIVNRLKKRLGAIYMSLFINVRLEEEMYKQGHYTVKILFPRTIGLHILRETGDTLESLGLSEKEVVVESELTGQLVFKFTVDYDKLKKICRKLGVYI